MNYRTTREDLFNTLSAWDKVMTGREKIHLIACGGTALTLLGYKESTKDVDLMVPNLSEYKRLITFLRRTGYRNCTTYGWRRPEETMIYDLYAGNRVYETELLDSPLKRGGHRKIREWGKIYLGALNPIDLIITKMFRGTQVDLEDCLMLLHQEKVSLKALKQRYQETASYDVSETKALRNLELLLKRSREGK